MWKFWRSCHTKEDYKTSLHHWTKVKVVTTMHGYYQNTFHQTCRHCGVIKTNLFRGSE